MMKKLLSVFLAVLLLVSLMPAVSAADNEGLSAAILKAKDKIAVTEEYTGFDSSFNTDETGNTVYHLYWYTEDEAAFQSFTAEINDRGDFLQYRNSSANPDSNEIHFAYLTGPQMKEAARNWLGWMNPGWLLELPDEKTECPEWGDPRHHVTAVIFRRQVDGMDYCGDYVRVSVNNLTGMIISMYANWTYETPAYSASDAISQEDAGVAFLNQSPMQLSYQLQGENHAIPVYTPKDSYLKLNARTGEEWIPYDPYRGELGSAGGVMNDAVSEESAAESEKLFSESERKNLEQVEGLLSEDALKKQAESLVHTGLSDAKFLSLVYQGYKEAEVTYYNAALSYLTTGEVEIRHTVEFDAQTGELLSYQSYPRNWDEGEGKVSVLDAQKTADAFLSAYAGEEFKKTSPEELSEDSRTDLSLAYIREENGIPYYGNRLSVTVDKHTGRIQSFYKNWDEDLTFAPADHLLSPEEAGRALLDKTGGMVLSYAKAQDGDSLAPSIDLMYALNSSMPTRIDAKTGQLLDYNSNPYTSEPNTLRLPEDLEGHYAKDQILALFQSGMLTLQKEETAFRPNDTTTRQEMLAFVCGLKFGYIPYDTAFASLARMADRHDLVYTDPNAPISREEAISYIIQALGYQELAELSGIYVTGFQDQGAVSPDKLGYLALAQGLSIVRGDENNCFNPKDSLTRCDAAIMIYNYLNR